MALSFPTTNLQRHHAKESIIVHEALPSVLFTDDIWTSAFSKKRTLPQRRTALSRVAAFAQFIYEKSHAQSITPLLVLIAYSLLGGYILVRLESPPEMELINKKAKFINEEKEGLLFIVSNVNEEITKINRLYQNDTSTRNLANRKFKKFAMNELHTKVYWYALSVYYLTEAETHKNMALRPRNAERLWREQMYSNIGRMHVLKNYTNQLALRCWEIGVENGNDTWMTEQVERAVNRFDDLTGLNNVLTPVWTFWNAMLLAVTTYTTIGYGNITAKSRPGQLAVMMYAVVGIPLVLMILHKLGRMSLNLLATMYQKFCNLTNAILGRIPEEEEEENVPTEIPLPLAIGVAFGWMFLCAGIYLHFEEDWDYFKSFYFFFCSLTTIGYGDVTPTHSEDMFIIFGLVLIGLSLVSMCINVIQLKLEKLFEELLLSLMEEYSTDPEARTLRGDKIGMMDMWRVWKRRKQRLREQAKKSKLAEVAGDRIAKVLPFARRRERQELIREIRQRMKQTHKSTQTERVIMYSFGCDPVFAPDRVPYLAPEDLRRKFAPLQYLLKPRMAAPEMISPYLPSPSTSSDVFLSTPPSKVQPEDVPPQDLLSTSRLPELQQLPLLIPKKVPPPSPPLMKVDETPPPPTNATDWASVLSIDEQSAHSIPQIHRIDFPPGFDPGRRWTFVETGKAPRGVPRGLVTPMMFSSAAPRHGADRRESTAQLLAEIDSRLAAAKGFATPSPYTSSGESLV